MRTETYTECDYNVCIVLHHYLRHIDPNVSLWRSDRFLPFFCPFAVDYRFG